MLNLRSTHQNTLDPLSIKTTLPDIDFIPNPILGNLGEPLDHEDGFESSFFLTDAAEMDTSANPQEPSTSSA